jgi:hypothetical protein
VEFRRVGPFHGWRQQQRMLLSVATFWLSQIGVTHWSMLTSPKSPSDAHACGFPLE